MNACRGLQESQVSVSPLTRGMDSGMTQLPRALFVLHGKVGILDFVAR